MMDPLDSGESPEEQLPTPTSAFPAGSHALGLCAPVANLSQIQLDLLSEQARALATMGEWKQLQAPAVFVGMHLKVRDRSIEVDVRDH